MNNKNVSLRIIFGVIIFLFSLVFGYFTSSYLGKNSIVDYWGALVIFAGLYVLIGVMVSQVFSISLGFLFSADILILNVLLKNFGDMANIVKVGILGLTLVVLYIVSWTKFSDKKQVTN